MKKRACVDFFEVMAQGRKAVTYGEVRLITGYSEVAPNDVSLETRFSRRVSLKIPIVSAAMDTVTGSRMAIAIAKLGGLGVLHRGLSPEEQGEEARRVKYHLSGVIAKPIAVREDATLEDVQKMREERKFSFHSFPVVDERGMLVGLITENDFHFAEESQKISEIMTRDLIKAPAGTSIDEAYERMRRAKKKVLPLVKDGVLAGMYLFSDLKRVKSGHSDMHNVDSQGRLRVAAAVGTGEDAFARLKALRGFVDVIVIDTAHGDSRNVFETILELKKVSGDIDIVAGNISQGESAQRLVAAGADGIKVGQGPGSICTTRPVCGIGRPQVSAIYSVTDALERIGSNIPICADGGIENSGDIPIAIGAGAHTVMLGKLLAGTNEAPGEVQFQFGSSGPMKLYYGMGSLRALEKSRASRDRYQQEDTGKDQLVPEGVEAAVPYVGELTTVMHQYIGGLRKGMGYVGAATVEELRERADFDLISDVGRKESDPHGVMLLKNPPNWRGDHE